METGLTEASGFELSDLLDAPERIFQLDLANVERYSRAEVEAFRFEAARRLVKRQSARIPVVRELLGDRDPDAFADLDDFVPLLLADDAYKGFDDAWIQHADFAALSRWLARFTANDWSAVDMAGCQTVTEWCERLLEQTGDTICHSSGTSGTLSFVPRSPRDIAMFVDAGAWNFQPPRPDGRRVFRRGECRHVHLFSPLPNRQFRITAGIHAGYHDLYGMHIHDFDEFLSPEFAMVQGRLRTAERKGTLDQALADPLVQKHRGEVEAYQAACPARFEAWVDDLATNYRGRQIVFQGAFDTAWNLALAFRAAGVRDAFAPGSLFSVVGGVKDGSVLPDDWKEQFCDAVGATDESFVFGAGMSEINCGIRQCAAKNFHFPPHLIPYLLKPHTREPLPRRGVQTGQLALLELVSQDNWGGMISSDQATIDWDSDCACGRKGPLLDPPSFGRLPPKN